MLLWKFVTSITDCIKALSWPRGKSCFIQSKKTFVSRGDIPQVVILFQPLVMT